jgi:enoyl-CoA hydratase/carnithine racemase
MPLRSEDVDGVRILTWDRPEVRNALDDALWDATRDGLTSAAGDDEVRCVVLTGAGGAFTSGQDLTEMVDPPHHPDGGEHHGYRGFIGVLESFDKPLLAAVEGVAVGFGATVLPYCDIVWIAAGARLKVPFMTLGVTTEAAGSLLLPDRMGWQAAARFIFTADWLSAQEAVDCGLALELTPDGEALEQALRTARRIAEMPLASLRTTKQLMVAGRMDAARAARQREDAAFVDLVAAMTAAGDTPAAPR